MISTYLFSSKRLGFRAWRETDLPFLTALNANEEVMQFFPKLLSQRESEAFLQRLMNGFEQKGYTYFAVEVLESSELIGFIGLMDQVYESPYTPNVDIGWRLTPKSQGKGYATEGAIRCLEWGFENFAFERIVSVCPTINTPSRKVMQKAGMEELGQFLHPALKDHRNLQVCVCFGIEKAEFRRKHQS